mgnify:FL=1
MKTAHLYEGKKDKKNNVGEKKKAHPITTFIK